jgi:hypothetical protein
MNPPDRVITPDGESKKATIMKKFYPPLDQGIKREVEILSSNGVETYESCEGGKGHSYPDPAVRFHGNPSAGWKALQVALDHALPVHELRRVWTIRDSEPTGPTWEMVFIRRKTP